MSNRMIPGVDRVFVTVTMDKSMLIQLDLQAEQQDVSRSALVRRIIHNYLTGTKS